jgi:uncharacterized protein YprB with RNaseH-like and TPR domain
MDSLYLDIETRWRNSYITVVGFYHERTGLRQLVWPDLTAETFSAALPDAERIYTFNGNSFDLRVIRKHLGMNLLDRYKSRDLMYDCRSRGLRGGLKVIERRLGITRELEPLTNTQIQQCWSDWKHRGDRFALERLLRYNGEDVMNLVELRRRLER